MKVYLFLATVVFAQSLYAGDLETCNVHLGGASQQIALQQVQRNTIVRVLSGRFETQVPESGLVEVRELLTGFAVITLTLSNESDISAFLKPVLEKMEKEGVSDKLKLAILKKMGVTYPIRDFIENWWSHYLRMVESLRKADRQPLHRGTETFDASSSRKIKLGKHSFWHLQKLKYERVGKKTESSFKLVLQVGVKITELLPGPSVPSLLQDRE